MDYKVEAGNLSGAVREAERVAQHAVLVDRVQIHGSEVVHTWSGAIASIGAPPVDGEILNVEFWDSIAEAWSPFAPAVTYGNEIGVCARVLNTGEFSQMMWLYHRYYDSNGDLIYDEKGVGAGVYAGSDMWLSRSSLDLRLVEIAEGWPTGDYTAELELWADIYPS